MNLHILTISSKHRMEMKSQNYAKIGHWHLRLLAWTTNLALNIHTMLK